MNEEIKISRKPNNYYTHDYELDNGVNKLHIMFGGTLDLYIFISTRNMIPMKKKTNVDFYISKDNYELYSIFDELYKDVIDGSIFGDDSEYKKSYKGTYQHDLLVNKDKSITWRSDDDEYKTADRLTITKEEDNYKLTFTREKNTDLSLKNGYILGVRIRNSGSRYDPFNVIFMRMFNKLQSIDPSYHQVNVEEVIYNQKVLSKKNK